MKKTLLLVAVCFAFIVANAQEKGKSLSQPPAPIKAAFEKTFAGASKITWEKEGSNYEVNFMQNSKEGSAVYNSAGQLLETEWEIKATELPKAATDYILQHYRGARIKEAASITHSNGTTEYEARVNGKDLIFDAGGKFLKTQKD